MAYFTQEQKKEMAPAIKRILKKYDMKGTLSIRHHSTVCLNLKSGSLDILTDYKQDTPDIQNITNCSISHNNRFSGQCEKFIGEILDVLYTGNHDDSDIMTDYFNVGWYVSVKIGSWDKPYIYNKPEAKKNTSMNPRYVAFTKTDLPQKKWAFINFISTMKRLYLESLGDFSGATLGQISNHDEFTSFIESNYMRG